MKAFPKAIYVRRWFDDPDDPSSDSHLLGSETLDSAEDNERIAVYQLVRVHRVEISKTLV
jgi:hypothetical protein